jgi:hypothetical protein
VHIGVTGHQKLPAKSLSWVMARIDDFLENAERPLVGITSLAIGADQLFAQRVLAHSGEIHAIIPHTDYVNTFKTDTSRRQYESLLGTATNVEILGGSTSLEMAYLLAGYRVVDLSDAILAIWDGRPAAGQGGTGDAVKYAVDQGVRVLHVNPITQTMLEL